MRILIPTSVGDLADRITILRIKGARIENDTKLVNVKNELSELEAVFERDVGPLGDAPESFRALTAVNGELWDVEEKLRRMEAREEFGSAFVATARRVYVLNDERFRLKRELSEAYGSDILEEKSHSDP